MKAPVTALILLLCCAAVAQSDPVPMVVDGRSWNGFEGGWVPTPVTYTLGEDTLLPQGTATAIHLSYDGSPAFQQGWLREDTVERQVWFVGLFGTDEVLYYDFSLEPGDSFFSPLCQSDVMCQSVDEVTWSDGTVSRKLVMQLLPDNPNFTETWIEGLGSLNGPLALTAYLCTADWDPTLCCVVENGLLRHDVDAAPEHPDCTGLPILDVAALPPPESPVPFVRHGFLHGAGATHMEVTDAGGRILRSGPCTAPWPIPAVWSGTPIFVRTEHGSARFIFN